jgi:hypothetical protein
VEPGVWLPKRFVETVKAKILGIKSYRTREGEIYSDYRLASDRASLKRNGSPSDSLADHTRPAGEYAMLLKMPKRFLQGNEFGALLSASKDRIALLEPVVGRR